MRLLNCDMVDNYAHKVTHGFTMVESDVFMEKTRIRNSDAMFDKLVKLNLSTIDTGFFNLYLGS